MEGPTDIISLIVLHQLQHKICLKQSLEIYPMLYEQKMLQVSFWFVTSQSNDVCGFGPGLKLNLNYMAEYTMLYLVIQSQMLFFRVILHYVLVNTHTYIIYFLYTYIDIYICKIPFILVVSSTKSRITCT